MIADNLAASVAIHNNLLNCLNGKHSLDYLGVAGTYDPGDRIAVFVAG